MEARGAFELAAAGVSDRVPRRPRIVLWGKKLRPYLNNLLSRYSLVSLAPILETNEFSWLRRLEEAAPKIQREADEILRHLTAVPPMNEMSPDHQRIAGDGGWRSFFLIGYRYRIEANCARCPETMKALSHVPGLVTALFSILEPAMHVGRHSGVSKGILIAHLGLRVPTDREACRMEVENRDVHWQVGKTFVFDDTFPHEVWNRTTDYRVILLVQFERPMALVGRLLTRLLVSAVRASPYIQDARRNIEYWEDRFKASEARPS